VFGKKEGIKEGDYIFSSKQDGEYRNIIFGAVSGVDGSKIGVNGLIVNPVGLKNKISQGKAGPRSVEILQNPTPENCIFALIYRTEHENFTEVLDSQKERIEKISPKVYSILDGWIRESLPELLNNVLSLPAGSEKDQAKRILKQRMDTLYDKNLKRNLYSVCRSLKILN
jgi:hypothetical protein